MRFRLAAAVGKIDAEDRGRAQPGRVGFPAAVLERHAGSVREINHG